MAKKSSKPTNQRFSKEARSAANDRQIELFARGYDPYWRLSKLLLIEKSLEERAALVGFFESRYGADFFRYEQFVHRNISNGLLSDGISELSMLCEDYFALLKFLPEKFLFAKKMMAYSAGGVNQMTKELRNPSSTDLEKYFFLPSYQLLEGSIAWFDAANAASTLKEIRSGVDRLRASHERAIWAADKFRDFHVRYKHGLKVCLNGLGNDLSRSQVDEMAKNKPRAIWGFSNDVQHGAAKGGLMIPDISFREIRMNMSDLAEEGNLLNIVMLHEVSSQELVAAAKSIASNISIMLKNRIALASPGNRRMPSFSLPTGREDRMTNFEFSVRLREQDRDVTLDHIVGS